MILLTLYAACVLAMLALFAIIGLRRKPDALDECDEVTARLRDQFEGK